MADGTVGLRFNVDVGNAPTQVERLTKAVAGLKEKLVEVTAEAEKTGDWKPVGEVLEAMNNATSARGQIMQQANQVQNAQARANMEMQKQNDPFHGMGAWIFQNAAIKITDGIVTAINTALSAAKMRASGDYTGAAVAYERGTGEMAGNLGGTTVGAGIGAIISAITGLPPNIVIPITSQIASSFGQLFGGMSARKKEENLAYSAQYKSALPGIDSLNQNFGVEINRKELDENNRQGLELRDRAVNAARGTGLDTEDFIGAMDKTASYGIRDVQQALNMTQTQALWSRFTGADLSTIQKYAGQAYRYGGDTGAVSTAYGGLMAQNMGKGQFSEFLNSMERILEEGIAKGFVRSSEEIAGNMAMLYKLSGNSALWQGEQGAQRLSQMNMAISNATNLQSVEDVISFGAARDVLNSLEKDNPLTEVNERAAAFEKEYKGAVYTDSYADVMQILERGVDPKLLRGQFEAVGRLENGNIAGTIERFRNMYGLNYTGAAQVYGMMDNMGKPGFSDDEIAEKIKTLQETPGMRSDSALLSDTLNSLRNDGIKIGQLEFDNTEIKLLREQAEILARELQIRVHGTGDPAQVIQPLPLPGGNPIDLQPVMAEELYRPRRFWESLDYTVSSRHFLENDQQSRAYIDAAAGETGRSVNDIIDWVIGGANRNRFDSNFQNFLDTALDASNRNAGVIDKEEYHQIIIDLTRSLHDFGVSMDRLRETNERLLEADRDIHVHYNE